MMTADPADLAGLAPIPPGDCERWSPAALAEAAFIAEALGLDLDAVVGATTVPAGGLDSLTLHTIGALIGLHRALVVVLGAEQGREWLHRRNSGIAFGGDAPAAIMQRDGRRGLLATRAVLDAMRGGTFPAMEVGEPTPVRLAPVRLVIA
ncbi:antitoxin Xre/MbcA/ParS toxin-binding domain-containing protein [Neoroseomonas soli]|uniref:DUF2384 domain-containing protein n=1 Tax=Neoroseomonas soli TaxID=1081025 RepID=A0A9X9WVJ0_9PROT|nr:antitoxin Xre/MbcA/ParS toxin-binding domain-containing protein [Neoroseomonas soli]MBR0671169.1 DUF2384 domain-containing protein [Neoroseomonas soli]